MYAVTHIFIFILLYLKYKHHRNMLVTKRKYPDRSLFVQNVTQIINEFKQNYDVFMTHKGPVIFDVMQIWPIFVYCNSAQCRLKCNKSILLIKWGSNNLGWHKNLKEAQQWELKIWLPGTSPRSKHPLPGRYLGHTHFQPPPGNPHLYSAHTCSRPKPNP